MQAIQSFCESLEHTRVAASVRESIWLFPELEIVHLLGMAALLGTVAAFDLRILGLALRGQSISRMAHRLLPWTWIGFAVQVITGTLLFSSEAVKLSTNPAFRLKILLIFAAGLNALIFHGLSSRNRANWDNNTKPPLKAKLAGLTSITLWIGVVAAGRLIGFI